MTNSKKAPIRILLSFIALMGGPGLESATLNTPEVLIRDYSIDGRLEYAAWRFVNASSCRLCLKKNFYIRKTSEGWVMNYHIDNSRLIQFCYSQNLYIQPVPPKQNVPENSSPLIDYDAMCVDFISMLIKVYNADSLERLAKIVTKKRVEESLSGEDESALKEADALFVKFIRQNVIPGTVNGSKYVKLLNGYAERLSLAETIIAKLREQSNALENLITVRRHGDKAIATISCSTIPSLRISMAIPSEIDGDSVPIINSEVIINDIILYAADQPRDVLKKSQEALESIIRSRGQDHTARATFFTNFDPIFVDFMHNRIVYHHDDLVQRYISWYKCSSPEPELLDYNHEWE